MTLTDTAETVLKRRYYLKDADGNPVETWPDLCRRVANHVASVEKEEDRQEWAQKFFDIIHDLDFLPNSPCLMNAGTDMGQLSACFVLPVEDSMESIFTAVKHGALVHKTGGGTGYSFSNLRAKNSAVQSTQGVASGPLSFMQVFDTATETIKQGGKRRGANMAVLSCDHPDILEFIDAKEDTTKFTNFNFSVAITDEFMRRAQVEGTREHDVMERIIDRAWRTGEPGVLFIDTANKANTIPHVGKLGATNPCGEQWLLPYESCNLGSINLSKFILDSNKAEVWHQIHELDTTRLEEVTRIAVRFLDNVIDCNKYPIPEIEKMTRNTRKIGLGIMGLHDMLIQLGHPYDSETGHRVSADVMDFIHDRAQDESENLAMLKGGAFPSYDPLACEYPPRRNAALTSIQPTGTVSMIADCASGCEPYFSIVMVKNVMDGDRLLMVNKHFERITRREGFYSDQLMQKVASSGTVLGHPEIPEKWQQVFKTAQDISPEAHVRMQAALQNNGVDSSISKTVNLPADATREDVATVYNLGWELGCKGITVYRDGCRAGQVLNAGPEKKATTMAPLPTVAEKKQLPDMLDAKRYRIRDTDGNAMYLIVCFDASERPMEVFAKFPFDNRIEQKDKATQWTTTCRMVSTALRYHIPMEEIIKQLERSSGSMFDLPAQLSKLLKSFMAGTQQGYSSPCPECSDGVVIFEEGCEVCKSCGYSKCS